MRNPGTTWLHLKPESRVPQRRRDENVVDQFPRNSLLFGASELNCERIFRAKLRLIQHMVEQSALAAEAATKFVNETLQEELILENAS